MEAGVNSEMAYSFDTIFGFPFHADATPQFLSKRNLSSFNGLYQY